MYNRLPIVQKKNVDSLLAFHFKNTFGKNATDLGKGVASEDMDQVKSSV